MSMTEDIDNLYHVGTNDFWLNAKNDLIIDKIKKKNAIILDVGCGTGSLTFELAKRGHVIDAIDISDNAVEYTRNRTKNMDVTVWKTTIENIDYKNKYDYIVLFDVLEHIEDDNHILNKAYDLLKNDGNIIICVPTIKKLYGRHDIYCEHIRRYNKKEIEDKLKNRGFVIIYIRYWNFIMLPIAFVFKILDKNYPHKQMNRTFLNKLLEFYYRKIENNVIFPLGISLFIIARKYEI